MRARASEQVTLNHKPESIPPAAACALQSIIAVASISAEKCFEENLEQGYFLFVK